MVGCKLQVTSIINLITKLVFVCMMLVCIPSFGYEDGNQIDTQIYKETSRLVTLLPTKRQIGHNKQMINDLRLAVVYNHEFSSNDDRTFLRSAKGVIIFIVIEKFGKNAHVYYNIIYSYSKILNIMADIHNFQDFEKAFFSVDSLKQSELDLLTKSKLSITLVPDSNSKIGAPWGILAFCGISGDVTAIRFGKGEWLDVNDRNRICPDDIANNLFQLVEHRR